MDAIALGPVALSLSRLFFLLGLLTFYLTLRWLERRQQRSLAIPFWGALAAGLVFARLAFVVQHWEVYAAAPLSSLYFWQDGYAPIAGLAGAAVFTTLHAWRARLPQPQMQLPLVAGALVWASLGFVAAQLEAQHQMPDLVLADLADQPAPLQQFAGQPVVINLWATWCPPCRREMPVLEAAQADQRDRMHFVFANQGEPGPVVSDYLQDEALNLDNVLLDPWNRLTGHFGARGLPTTLFFDSDGRMVNAHMGELSAARLRHYLQQLD